MIKSVTVTNHLGETIEIVLTEAEPEHGLLITSMEGLGPAKANINTTDISMFDGALYNSARLEMRNILITLLFVASPMIEDARQRTYQYFPIKRNVEMVIETDNRTLSTIGYVESNEPDIFSEQEGCTISLICPDPYLYSADGLRTSWFYGIEPMFEFEFSNESDEAPLLLMGEINADAEKKVYYEGDIPIGVTLTVHALRECGSITMYNTRTLERMRIDSQKISEITGKGIQELDDIVIETTRGNKSVRLLRNGQYTDILNALDKDSDWFTLEKGVNTFVYEADSGGETLQFKVDYRVAYEGV